MSVRFAPEVKESTPPEPVIHQDWNLDIDEDALYANYILDVIFESRPNEKLGFTVRIDTDKQILQINHISPEGEAERVGLKQGDIILAVNDENIGQNPQIGIDELKKAKSSTEVISITLTVCRRIFDHIMIKVQRSGIEACDGKYIFIQLDEEYNSPIFMNKENKMLILKSNYDVETAESLWAICDESNTYYVGVSMDLMPPNDSWSPIEDVGKYPCPGLVFYNTQQKLIEIEEKKNKKLPAVLKKQESKLKMRAMSNPLTLSKHSRVFQTIHDQSLLIAAGVDGDDDGIEHFEDEEDDANEWKIKYIARYSELMKKCKKREQHLKILRGVLKDMNASFYEYWLRDKIQQDENEKLKENLEMMTTGDDSNKGKEIKELQETLKHLKEEKNAKISDLQKEIEMLKGLKETDSK